MTLVQRHHVPQVAPVAVCRPLLLRAVRRCWHQRLVPVEVALRHALPRPAMPAFDSALCHVAHQQAVVVVLLAVTTVLSSVVAAVVLKLLLLVLVVPSLVEQAVAVSVLETVALLQVA